MSLDDDVIREVYKHSLPPTPSLIRLPPLLWAQLRQDLGHHLEERWTAGVATIAFSNRRLSEAASSRYLKSERRGRSLRILAEYFLGRWSGKLKPASVPGLSLLLSDRKVPTFIRYSSPDYFVLMDGCCWRRRFPPSRCGLLQGWQTSGSSRSFRITCCMLVCGRSYDRRLLVRRAGTKPICTSGFNTAVAHPGPPEVQVSSANTGKA